MIDVDRAQVTREKDGTVVIDDPGAPVVIRVKVDTARGRAIPSSLTVEAREGQPHISSALLSRIPLTQIVLLAASTTGTGYPDEPYYRQLARPKPRGLNASWDPQHWQRVLAVYEWAERVKRPGGGAVAVADFWGVTINPTVYRWLRIARGRAPMPG